MTGHTSTIFRRNFLVHLLLVLLSPSSVQMKVQGRISLNLTDWPIRLASFSGKGQDMNFHEINSVMTRIGVNTRVIFTGDIIQSDLPHTGRDKSGMRKFLDAIKDMEGFESVQFTRHDIVRSEFVKSWIIATENLTMAA